MRRVFMACLLANVHAVCVDKTFAVVDENSRFALISKSELALNPQVKSALIVGASDDHTRVPIGSGWRYQSYEAGGAVSPDDCLAQITVTDSFGPKLRCPQELTVQASHGGTGLVYTELGETLVTLATPQAPSPFPNNSSDNPPLHWATHTRTYPHDAPTPTAGG